MSDPARIAIAVVEEAGRFLIGQRPPGVPLAGLWEFPGGKVEAGESAQQAAIRECREETGIEVAILGEYPEQVQHYDHGVVQLRFFRCAPLQPGLTPRSPFQWAARRTLQELTFPQGNAALLKLLREEP